VIEDIQGDIERDNDGNITEKPMRDTKDRTFFKDK
jgi:hypothetical protein